jgi:hypothetical protein
MYSNYVVGRNCGAEEAIRSTVPRGEIGELRDARRGIE